MSEQVKFPEQEENAECFGNNVSSQNQSYAQSETIPNQTEDNQESSTKSLRKKDFGKLFNSLRSTLKRVRPVIVSQCKRILTKEYIRGILGAVVTMFLVPQLLNAYNTWKNDSAALKDTVAQIAINYEAGNYNEMEQGFYSVYPKLQEKNDYKTLLILSDMFLGAKYQMLYQNQVPLSSEQEDLIYLYANNALEYASKQKDTAAYIKYCVHIALFNIAEYEFTYNTKYLDNADNSLNAAGEYFDRVNGGRPLTICNETEADIACQFYNLKNLQQQVSYYRALIACSSAYTSGTVQNAFSACTNLILTTSQFVATVHIIQDENADLCLVPEDEIQYMILRGSLAYIRSGNLMFDYGGMPPILLSGGSVSIPPYFYSEMDQCSILLRSMEQIATENNHYEELFDTYKVAETYFFLKYISGGVQNALVKYDEYVDKLQALNPSGSNLTPYVVEPGNGVILSKYIDQTEQKLSEMTFGKNPFGFSMLCCQLGSLYMERARAREESGDITNAGLDYENANKNFNTALIYFGKENRGIFEMLQQNKAKITDRLSGLIQQGYLPQMPLDDAFDGLDSDADFEEFEAAD